MSNSETLTTIRPTRTIRIRSAGYLVHMRKHPVRTVLSLAIGLLLLRMIWAVFAWGVLDAVWMSPDGAACRSEGAGACWAVITTRWRVILFGLYPYAEQWRSGLGCLAMLATALLSCSPRMWTPGRLALLWIGGFVVFAILMGGGVAGLTPVAVRNWGGLALTLFVFVSVVLLIMPMALILLFLQTSRLPVIRRTTQFIIDAVRSLPLLVVLFIAGILLPFGMPDFLVGEKLFRVIFAFALYNACYQAEILRGGVESLPAGQDEAARALGIGYLQRMRTVILPQAFKVTLPSTVNQIVIVFLETPLIVIIGFFDVLASGAAAFGTAEWGIAAKEVYIFIGLIFFIFSFSLSRYGAYLEKRLARSNRT